MAVEHLTKSANIDVRAREIDFVSRFSDTWEALRNILGIMRPIKKVPGSVLKYKKARVVLQNGNVGEGENIPLSEAFIDEVIYDEMDFEKFEKGVSAEAIKNHGYDVAIGMTDNAFLNELQGRVMDRFYTYLNTGALTNRQANFQKAMALAKGLVVNQFKKLHKTITEVVGFANVLDVYEYIGAQTISVQNEFGFTYIKNFMGYNTVFLLSDEEIARGKVVATPVDNIDLYYVDPSDSDFARAGLVYTVDGATPLIGFHTEGSYGDATSRCYALMGMTLFAEYIDGIAVVTVDNGSIGTLGVTSVAGTATGATKLTVTNAVADSGKTYFVKAAAAAVNVTYLEEIDNTWVAWDGTSDVAGLTGAKVTVVETNGSRQALAVGNATLVVKS